MKNSNSDERKLSSEDYLKAFALWTMAARHYAKCREFESALADILGYEDVYCGCVSDQILEPNGSFDVGLKGEKFYVQKP